jgi:hypothetical protein
MGHLLLQYVECFFFINMAALSLSGLYDWIDKFNAFLAAIGLLCEYWFQVCRYGN